MTLYKLRVEPQRGREMGRRAGQAEWGVVWLGSLLGPQDLLHDFIISTSSRDLSLSSRFIPLVISPHNLLGCPRGLTFNASPKEFLSALSWFRTKSLVITMCFQGSSCCQRPLPCSSFQWAPTALAPVFLHPLLAPLTLPTLYKSSFIEASSFEPGGGPFYFLPGRRLVQPVHRR